MARKALRRTDTAKSAFVRGFIASGMMAATDRGPVPVVASRALKAGIAVATGALAADLMKEKAPAQAALALAGGALCMMVVARSIAPPVPKKESEAHG